MVILPDVQIWMNVRRVFKDALEIYTNDPRTWSMTPKQLRRGIRTFTINQVLSACAKRNDELMLAKDVALRAAGLCGHDSYLRINFYPDLIVFLKKCIQVCNENAGIEDKKR